MKYIIVSKCFLFFCSLNFAFLFSGCTNTSSSIANSPNKEDQLPALPSSVQRRLLDTVGIYSIASLQELVYLGGSNEYIGVGGAFGVNWGSVFHYSFVLQKNPDALSWNDATVYKWLQSDWVTYRDGNGEKMVRDIRSIIDLLSLPERVFTNLLVEVSSMESAWTEEELAFLDSRKKAMLINSGL